METISPQGVLQKLENVPAGAHVLVAYFAGREPTPRAIHEASRAREAGIPLHHYTGILTSVWTTRHGDIVFTVYVNERDGREGNPGAYRTFNPSLGDLLLLEVIEDDSHAVPCPHCGQSVRSTQE